jgi:hypothetical protein
VKRAGIVTALGLLLGTVLGVGPVLPAQAVQPADRVPAAGLLGQARQQEPAGKPEVTRLTPSSGSTAGGYEVVIKGRGLTGVKRVLFGTAKATGLRAKSARKLVVSAPAHDAGQVKVRVVTDHGASKQTGATRFTYITPRPALTGLSTSAGPSAGGTTVTLIGRDLAGASAVRFGTVAASYRVLSPTAIAATAPAHVPGQANVTVTAPGGSAVLQDAYTFVAAPQLTGITPDSGPADGATVTLTGANFTGDATVRFGGVPAADLQLSAGGTELTVTTPDHTPGWVDVSVTTVGGSATLVRGYLFVGGTTLSGVSPVVGPATGGPQVTLTGTGFTEETLVLFGNKPSLSVVVAPSGTSLTATLPTHAAGPVDVEVGTEGDSATLVDAFTYVAAPTLTSVTPTAGPLAGGTTVTLTGTGLRSGMEVRFGGLLATLVSVAPAGTSATVTTPARTAGLVDVSVTTPGGTSTLTDGFAYAAVPTLTGVSPGAGPSVGGQTVTLTGSGLRAGMQVSFGGTPASGLSVLSSTQATVTTPAHAAGAVDVSVTTPGGSGTLPNGYTYVVAPVLTSVAADEGPVAGGQTVTLTGAGFRAGMQVAVGGAPATDVTVLSGTQATVTTPAHPVGPVDVTVSTPGGSSTLGSAYTYVVAPTLTGASPSAGPTGGGTTVVLTGSGFRPDTQVLFGSTAAAVASVGGGGTELTVTTPAHSAGVADVTVSTPGGSAGLDDAYTFVVPPTLTGVAPSEGPASGGTAVTLTGSGFTQATQVTFGGTTAVVLTVNPAGTVLTAATPSHAAAPVDVTVTVSGGSATKDDAFTYVAAPTITGASPDHGPTAGGQTVTLSGSGFRSGMQVSIGGTPATGVNVVSPTQATVVTPSHAAGAVDVSVSTLGGSATLDDGYSYVVAPTLTSVSPTSGPTTGGTSVTLTGTGLTGTTAVTFDGVAATSVVVVSDTEVTATAPAHSAGAVDVSVTTPGGQATLDDAFTYVVVPVLTGITPDSGTSLGGTTVTLSGTGLTGTTSVTFDGVAATNLIVLSDTEVTADTPPHLPGAVDVQVVAPAGSSTLAGAFTYTLP